jgi:SAM-dependent methyltransferase
MKLEDFDLQTRTDKCPACTSTELEFAFDSVEDDWSVAGFKIDRCLGCSTHFINPRPAENSLNCFYSEIPSVKTGYLERSANYYLNSQRRAELKKYYLDPLLRHANSGQLLDFAACTGWFMRLAGDHGFSVEGIEFSKEAVKLGRDRLGLTTLRQGNHFSLPDSPSYDVIAGHAIIEHLLNPEDFLNRAFQALVPGGLLYLSYPTCDTPMFNRFQQFGYYTMAPYHLTHFSEQGIKILTERSGFINIQFERVRESGMWGHAMASHKGLLNAYRTWRDDRRFVEYDMLIDGLIDDLVHQLGLSPVQLLFARRPL